MAKRQWETAMMGGHELPKPKNTPFEYPHRWMMPWQLDRQQRFCLGDTIAKFTLSAWMSAGKTGFWRRVRKRLMVFAGEQRTIVVPTTSMIKPRQLPAQSFESSQVKLWYIIAISLLARSISLPCHSFPRPISLVFHCCIRPVSLPFHSFSGPSNAWTL